MLGGNFVSNEELRKRQIDTLKIFNHNVTEITSNEEYRVGFQLNDHEITMSVYLGNNFPNEHPRFVLSPVLNHHWVSPGSGEIISAPGLVNFTVHSDLGRVVQAIIREFERFPPSLVTDGQQTNIPQTQPQASRSPQSNNFQFPELANLSIDQLELLSSDSQYLDDFVEEMTIVRTANEELDSLLTEVEELAGENDSQRQLLVDTQKRHKEIVEQFQSLGARYEQLNSSYKKKSEIFTPQHIQELLQIAVSTADSICEAHVDDFLNGKCDVQSFLANYMEAKKLSAMRKAKEERLAMQLREFERANH